MSSNNSRNKNDMNVLKMGNLSPLQQMYKILTFHETRLHNIESKINELQTTLTPVDVNEQVTDSSHEQTVDSSNERNNTPGTQGKKNKHVKLEMTE